MYFRPSAEAALDGQKRSFGHFRAFERHCSALGVIHTCSRLLKSLAARCRNTPCAQRAAGDPESAAAVAAACVTSLATLFTGQHPPSGPRRRLPRPATSACHVLAIARVSTSHNFIELAGSSPYDCIPRVKTTSRVHITAGGIRHELLEKAHTFSEAELQNIEGSYR